MPKIYAILGGGDWADASVHHLVLPEGMDIDSEQKLYVQWYREVYAPAVDLSNKTRTAIGVRFIQFEEFLISKGARATTDDELEQFVSDW